MAKDGSDINAKLWSRKKLKARREKNDHKHIRKAYFKLKDGEKGDANLTEKQQQFYNDLYKKEDNTTLKDKIKEKKEKKKDKKEAKKSEAENDAQVKADKSGFNKGLNRIKESAEQIQAERQK